MYTLCRTDPSLAANATTAARPHMAPAAAGRTRHAPNLEQDQQRELGPQTVLPSAAWALQDCQQPRQVAHSGSTRCTEASRPHVLGTPKVGLSTWTWGGASATLTAVAGMPVAAAPAQPAALPQPPRPQTARPFRIRSRMERELHSGSHSKVCSVASLLDGPLDLSHSLHIMVLLPVWIPGTCLAMLYNVPTWQLWYVESGRSGGAAAWHHCECFILKKRMVPSVHCGCMTMRALGRCMLQCALLI